MITSVIIIIINNITANIYIAFSKYLTHKREIKRPISRIEFYHPVECHILNAKFMCQGV